jgi:hypothetical protein
MNGFTTCSLLVLWNDDVIVVGRVLVARLARTFGLPRCARARQAAENIVLAAATMAGAMRLRFCDCSKCENAVFTPRVWWNAWSLRYPGPQIADNDGAPIA